MNGERLTGWRRIASAIWSAPSDPQIYGMFELDATNMSQLMNDARANGHRVTPTHLIGRALTQALRAVPSLNVRLAGGRAVPRASIDVFFITSVANGRDLTGVKIAGMERKPVLDVAAELEARSSELKRGRDPELARAKRFMDALPFPLLRLAVRATAWLVNDRALGIDALGLAAEPFGSAMVSSVGMLGLPNGFTPLVWLYHVPVIVLAGEMIEKPLAVNGRVEIRPVLPITATVDHRYVDGAELAQAFKAFRSYLENPASFERDLRTP